MKTNNVYGRILKCKAMSGFALAARPCLQPSTVTTAELQASLTLLKENAGSSKFVQALVHWPTGEAMLKEAEECLTSQRREKEMAEGLENVPLTLRQVPAKRIRRWRIGIALQLWQFVRPWTKPKQNSKILHLGCLLC